MTKDQTTATRQAEISRGTKCFSAFHGTDTQGAFPKGFLDWVKKMGWINGNICHLCSGRVTGEGFRVDIRPEMSPDLIADARNTGLPDENFTSVVIDPPYSEDLAHKLYGTREHYASINQFVKEGVRLIKEGGTVVTLSYEIPKIPKTCELVAVWGIYTVPHTAFMRCFAVFRKTVACPQSDASTTAKTSTLNEILLPGLQ